MANQSPTVPTQKGRPSLIDYARAWGDSSAPPTILAALVLSQHLHPPQWLPLTFPPVLLFSSYLNLSGYKTDAAGTSAAWSGLYFLLARRRRQPMMRKWGARGVVRGATMGLCAVNFVGGATAYLLGRRSQEPTDETRPSS